MEGMKSLLEKSGVHLSWNPVNCFNLSRLKPVSGRGMNTFQLEWKSRAMCRTYFCAGLTERQFRRIFKEHHSDMEQTLCHLERRLDRILFRALFANSIYVARNMIFRGHVLVNGKIQRQSGTTVDCMDHIQILPAVAPRVYRNTNHPLLRLWAHIPDYLEVDYETLSAILVSSPNFASIPNPFDKNTFSNFSSFYTRRF